MLLESAPTKQDEGGALSLQNPARNPNTKRNQHLQSNWVPKTQGVCVVKHRALPTVNITANRQLIQLPRTTPGASTASTACLRHCPSLPATQTRSAPTLRYPKHEAQPKTRSTTKTRSAPTQNTKRNTNTKRTNTAAPIAKQAPMASPDALRPPWPVPSLSGPGAASPLSLRQPTSPLSPASTHHPTCPASTATARPSAGGP